MGEQELKWNDLGFGKMFFDIVMPFLAYYLIHSACYSLIDHLLNHVGYEGGLSAIPAGWATCLNGVSMVVGGVALLFFLKQDDLLKPPAGIRIPQFLKTCGITLVLGSTMAIGFNMLILYSGISRISPQYSNAVKSLYAVDIFMGVILYGIVAPIVEETLFRGIIFGRVRRFPTSVYTAAMVSGLLFGIYHGNLVQGVYGFLIGTVFALAYDWTGKLWVPMFLHGIANLSIYLLNTVAPKALYSVVFSPAGTVVSLLLTAAGLFILYRKRVNC